MKELGATLCTLDAVLLALSTVTNSGLVTDRGAVN